MKNKKQGRLQGKVALITGAAAGIGRTSAELFAKEGASVLMVDRDDSAVKEILRKILSQNGRAEFFKADLVSASQIKKMVVHAVRKFGTIDILFNNAGVHGIGSTPENIWDNCLAINLKAAYLASCEVLPYMRKNGGGSIINNASISGPVVGFASPHYDASKGGLTGLTRHLASTWGKYGIRVNALCPGFTMTSFTNSWSEQKLKTIEKDVALGRLANPVEIARVALFLGSDDSSYITGASIVVDGGWTIHFAKY